MRDNYKSEIIRNLQKRVSENDFFHLTLSEDELEYFRDHECTVEVKQVYGGEIAEVRDTETQETIELPVYR